MARTFHTFDLIIIGDGSAGISALKEARKYTDNVIMVAAGETGTTCARVGCMPTKALIHAAKLYDSHKKMPQAGIIGSEQLTPDIPSVLENVRKKRDKFVSDVKAGVEELGEHIVQGYARFETPTTIRVGDRLYHTKATVIATGSKPFIPEKYSKYHNDIITSDTLFERRDLPKRIAVIGLGAVGLEMSQAFAELNIDITAITMNDRIGVVSDPKINETIKKALAEDMRVWLDTEPNIKKTSDGILLHTPTKETLVDGLFIATGRTPNLKKLGLNKIGVHTNGTGIPRFNRYTMKVPDVPIYMAGDVTDEHALLHESVDEGRRAAYHALHSDVKDSPRYQQIEIIFTKPVIAVVGDTDYAMRHDTTVTGEVDFKDQGRAKIENENFGKIRLFADQNGGYFRGAEIMAPAAEHLAHFLAMALTQRMSINEILETPFYHPTLEEGLKTALEDAASKTKFRQSAENKSRRAS